MNNSNEYERYAQVFIFMSTFAYHLYTKHQEES